MISGIRGSRDVGTSELISGNGKARKGISGSRGGRDTGIRNVTAGSIAAIKVKNIGKGVPAGNGEASRKSTVGDHLKRHHPAHPRRMFDLADSHLLGWIGWRINHLATDGAVTLEFLICGSPRYPLIYMSSRRGRENHVLSPLIFFIWGWLVLIGIHDRRSIAWSDERDPAFDFLATNLTIFRPTDRQIIGHARYSSSKSDGTDLIRGENKYLDGARDVELDYLRPGDAGLAPTLVRHEYSSFNVDGSPQFVESLDPASGDASCAEYVNGTAQASEATLDVPSDTYAGATQMMFIVAALRQGAREPIKFHSFNCAPTPKIILVKVSVPTEREEWPMYPGRLVKLELEPDFGWLGILLSPFLPKIYAWFDPNDKWNYVGALYDRYYKSPHILTVRDRSR
jgi:hypothetical protein